MTDHSLRKILPRRVLQDIDNTRGRYPTVLRTGDLGRTGNFKIFYDDLTTPVFSSGSVSYPTLLTRGIPELSADLTSSIFASTTRTDMGVTERWRQLNTQLEPISPFKEAGFHEQDLDKTSAGYLTGSSVSEVGLEFKQNIGSKTIFRLEVPVRAATQLDPLTASVYYYNWTSGQFEEIAPALKEAPGQLAINLAVGSILMNDAKMFDPYGNPVISGSSWIANLSSQIVSNYYAITNFGDVVSTLSYEEAGSVFRNSAYAASSQQVLNAGFLNRPFLLERVTVEMPLRAGSSWLNDFTQLNANQVAITASGAPSTAQSYILGGPCLTFALSNQVTVNRRDLILSATIVPYGDAQKTPALVGSVQQSAGTFATFNYAGFGARATPACVVSGTNGQFTGSVRFDGLPQISAGTVLAQTALIVSGQIILNGAAGFDLNSPYGYLMSVTPVGRAKDARVAGRSIFGRERTVPKNKTNVYESSLSNIPLPDNDLLLIPKNINQSAYSPYLIMPGDNLVFSLSKYHSSTAMTRPNQNLSASNFPLSASHDVYVDVGTMKITLYGSELREMSEFHDTLNSDLTTNSVHQIIGRTVADQWNVETPLVYSGSYTDNIVTGSFALTNGQVGRGVIGTKSATTSSIGTDPMVSNRLKRTYELGGTNLFVQATSRNERFWDSLVPGPDQIAAVFSGSVAQGTDSSGNALLPGLVAIEDGYFPFRFPYGPDYSALPRKQDLARRVKALTYNFSSTGPRPTPDLAGDSVTFSIPTYRVIGNIALNYVYLLLDADVTKKSAISDAFSAPPIEQAAKYFYGFGDGVTTVTAPLGNGNFNLQPCSNFPILQYSNIHGFYASNPAVSVQGTIGVLIRGWKYGLVSALPTYSRAYFRRDKFGQLRDMLEQRLDAPFYESVGYKSDGSLGGVTGKLPGPVQVRFVGSDGSFVSPDRTTSSNLSSEVTSSVPYFENETRNRPPLGSSIGTNIVAPLVI